MDLKAAAQTIIDGLLEPRLMGATSLAIACGETAIGKGMTVFIQVHPTISSIYSLQQHEYPHSTMFHVTRVIEAAQGLIANRIVAPTHSELVALAHIGLERFRRLGITADRDRQTFKVPSAALFNRNNNWHTELGIGWHKPDDKRYFLRVCPTTTLVPDEVQGETRRLVLNLTSGWNLTQFMGDQERENHAQQLCAHMAQARVVRKYS